MDTSDYAARATAAFPVGFPTVSIKVPRSIYKHRGVVPPAWMADSVARGDEMYEYAATDGGGC